MNSPNLSKSHTIGFYLFFFFMIIYFLSARGYIAVTDSEFSLQTAKAVVENHTFSLDPSVKKWGWGYYESKDGKIYSRYGILLPLLWLPYVIAGKTIACFTNANEDRMINFFVSFYNIFFGAGSCVVMFYLARFFKSSKRDSLIIALLLGLTTLCWRYSVWDFSEATQMFFFMAAVYSALRNTLRSLLAASFFLSVLLLLKPVYVIYIPLFLIYILWRGGQLKKENLRLFSYFILFSIVGLSVFCIFNYIRFHNIFETGWGNEASLFYPSRIPNFLFFLWFSFRRGLFIYCPVLLFGILGYRRFYVKFRKEATFFLCIIIVNLLFYAMWIGSPGGWCWGPRYLVPVIPFYLLPVFVYFSKRGLWRIFFVFVAACSFILQLSSVLVSDNEYKHIKLNMVDKEISHNMPPEVAGPFLILKHKLFKGGNTYALTEFGINSENKLDDSEYETFRGFDLWYCHLARYCNRPILRFIPVLFLPILFIIFNRLWKLCSVLG